MHATTGHRNRSALEVPPDNRLTVLVALTHDNGLLLLAGGVGEVGRSGGCRRSEAVRLPAGRGLRNNTRHEGVWRW